MVSIVKATTKDAPLLTELAKNTFIESHGHSAKPEEIQTYVSEKYSLESLTGELFDLTNIYFILYYNSVPAGFSKINLNYPYPGSNRQNVAKMDRIYLLKEFYDKNLGSELLNFNMEFIKENQQAGIWLYVWKENPRAVKFYLKNKFSIIGSHDFRISENHSNPNHQMLRLFD